MDKYYGNVCELDIIFNFQKAYFILDELLLAGEMQESSKKNVLRCIAQEDSLEEMEVRLAPFPSPFSPSSDCLSFQTSGVRFSHLAGCCLSLSSLHCVYYRAPSCHLLVFNCFLVNTRIHWLIWITFYSRLRRRLPRSYRGWARHFASCLFYFPGEYGGMVSNLCITHPGSLPVRHVGPWT